MTVTELATTLIPVPPNRGRWRVTLHRRPFVSNMTWQNSIIAELAEARGRRLTKAWNQPAEFTFTLDGHAPEAPLVLELATEVVAWRWEERLGRDVPMFRGLIDHSEDQLTDTSSVVTFVAHDYLAMLNRRIFPQLWQAVQVDQDDMVQHFLTLATTVMSSSGNATSPGGAAVSFQPGSYLPFTIINLVNPDGSPRGAYSGQLRDRTYPGNTNVGQALTDLAAVINGFDFDLLPLSEGNARDGFRIFYPQQGVTRSDVTLVYGSNVNALTRTVASGDYANYVRVLGNNNSSDVTTPQLYGEAWNTDSNNVTVNPVGLWMLGDNASDVSIQSSLNDKAQGDLNLDGILVPSYTVTLRPGAYSFGYPNMGDTVGLVVKKGRLNVNTSIRVLGITYDVGDDGQEDVELVLGRPLTTLTKLFTQADRDVDALTRR